MLLISVLALPTQRLFAQTFEQPVTVLEDARLVNWHSDAEVNPNDATVDMLYTSVSEDLTKFRLHYLKLFTDGTIWRSVELTTFDRTPDPGWIPPSFVASVTEYAGRVFVIACTDDGDMRFFASDDGGATFAQYPPSTFMRRADILANEHGVHVMSVNQNFDLVYGKFDPLQKTWTFQSPAVAQGVLSMRPSLAEGNNQLFVVYQAADTLHYERSALANGTNWSTARQIPNSKLIEYDMEGWPPLGPRVAATGEKVYAGWSGSPPGGADGPLVGTSRRSFSDPSWQSDPNLSLNLRAFGLAANSTGIHYVYFRGKPWDLHILAYRSWKDSNTEPSEPINIFQIYEERITPRMLECVAHELGVSVLFSNPLPTWNITMVREQFDRPAPPAGLYVVASTSGGDQLKCQDDGTIITEVTTQNDDHLPQNCPVDDSQNLAIELASSSQTYHPLLRWYRNNFEYQVAQYIIWRRVVPSEDESWKPIDSVAAPATEYLDRTMIFDPLGGFFAQYRVVAKSRHGDYSDFSNMASIRASNAFGKIASNGPQTESMPKEFSLRQNYPNPFNPTTIVEFQLPAQGQSASMVYQTSLKLYNIHGQLVRTIANGSHGPGIYRFVVDASSLASGVYFYRLDATSSDANYSARKKMILLK